MKEWLLELGKAFFWLFLFLVTYGLLVGGATFVVHGCYAVASHVILGLPNLGIAAGSGPQAAKVGWGFIAVGVCQLVGSLFVGRYVVGLQKLLLKNFNA